MVDLKTIEGIYVGEYSPNQGCYNICSLSEMLNTNIQMIKKGVFNGYIPLCIGAIEDVKKTLGDIQDKYGRPRIDG